MSLAISSTAPRHDPEPLETTARDVRRADARGAHAQSTAGRVRPTTALGAHPLADPATLVGLGACVADARASALSRKGPPPDPASFALLRERTAAAVAKLPPEYRRAVGEPLLRLLERMGPEGYASVLARDPDRQGAAALLLDAAQAVLQRGEGYEPRATGAFQEVVSDLYEGFVAAEGREGVSPPEAGTLPPLVRWGSAEGGPSTWPATATAALGVKAGVVSLPAANAAGGLLAWPALAHEAGGHDLLEADRGLTDELAGAVEKGLSAERFDPAIASYWSTRVEEAAADVMGVLNMGPAAAVGLVGYFRAMNGAWRGTAALRNVGRAEDPHPADIARAYLAAETVRLLSFRGAGRWADRLEAEIDRDLGRIWLGKAQVSAGVAKGSAAAVARAIVQTRLASLEGHALGEIQGWSDRDESIVTSLRQGLSKAGAASAGEYAEGAFAAHAVAAAIYEAVAAAAPPERLTGEMIAMLDAMHARNRDWAPRRVASYGPPSGNAPSPRLGAPYPRA